MHRSRFLLAGVTLGAVVVAGPPIATAGCFKYVSYSDSCTEAGVMGLPCPATVYLVDECNCVQEIDEGEVGMSSFDEVAVPCAYVDRVWDSGLGMCVDNGGIQIVAPDCDELSGSPCSKPGNPPD